jgi:hypothetical protein
MNDKLSSSQKGQTLMAALVVSFVLAVFGYTLMKLVIFQMQVSVETKRKDRILSVGDAAMQRAISVLSISSTSGNWVSPTATTLDGYNSLTAVGKAYTDIPGAQYWIKILENDRSDTPNAYGAVSDTAVALWQKNGDDALDRTIFVRVVDTKTGKEDSFYNIIHRNTLQYTPGGEGIATTGCMDLGQTWDGDSYNSCLGAYGAAVGGGLYNYSDPSNGAVLNGSVHSNCISNGGSSFTLTRNTTAFAPPPDPSYYYAQETNYFPLTSTVTLISSLPDITGDTIVGAIGISSSGSPAPWPNFWGGGAYRIGEMNTSGSKVVQMDVSRGFVHIYAYEPIDLDGNVQLLVISPTSVVVVDAFTNTYTYNNNALNTLGFPTNAIGAGTIHGREDQDIIASHGLMVSVTAGSNYVWYTCLTLDTAAVVANEVGYRVLSFDVSGTTGTETFRAGMAYWNYATANMVTVMASAAVSVTTAVVTHYIPFSSVAPTSLTLSGEVLMRRIVFDSFNATTVVCKVFIDNVKISRYGGPFCCTTADAVLYGMSSSNVGLSGTGRYQCLLYFPNSDVAVTGAGHGYFDGAIIAKSFNANGGGAGAFHYDQCLAQNVADTYAAPPIVTTQWRQVGKKY